MDLLNKQLQINVEVALVDNNPSAPSAQTERQILSKQTISIALNVGMADTPHRVIAGPARHNSLPSTAQAKRVSPGRHVFDFLGLPRELRDMVYKELVPGYVRHQGEKANSRLYGLLLANKQTSNELREHLSTATYLLHFRLCPNTCTCRRQWRKFDASAAYRPPPSDLPIQTHSLLYLSGLLLAKAHRIALERFEHVEILWNASPATMGNLGAGNLVNIARAIGPLLLSNATRFKRMVKLTLQWKFPSARKAIPGQSDEYHIARMQEWYRYLKMTKLDVVVEEESLHRGQHFYTLTAKLKVGRM